MSGEAKRPGASPAIVRGWTPARFLLIGGITLTTIGSTGAIGLLGRVSQASLFHPPSWINWLHLSAGLALIPISLRGSRRLQRGITFLPAVAGTAIGLMGLLAIPYAARHHRTGPTDLSDHITHLCVGGGALWALWNTRPQGSDRGFRVPG